LYGNHTHNETIPEMGSLDYSVKRHYPITALSLNNRVDTVKPISSRGKSNAKNLYR